MYDLKLWRVCAKKVNGGTYYYLREMARVDGKPKRVSERHLGTAEDIAAAMAARDGAAMPQRSRHLASLTPWSVRVARTLRRAPAPISRWPR